MNNYYVYYRVDPERLGELADAVERLFAAVVSECGVRGRWMRRRDDAITYMEVYEGVRVDVRFEELVGRAAAALEFQSLLESGTVRHTECFVAAKE